MFVKKILDIANGYVMVIKILAKNVTLIHLKNALKQSQIVVKTSQNVCCANDERFTIVVA
jgi:hypothetical protein